MLHHVLKDGTLVFIDGFGLTRLNPDGKVKSNGNLYQDVSYRSSVAGDPPNIMMTSSYGCETKVLDVASLKLIKKLNSPGSALLPSGQGCIKWNGSIDFDGNVITESEVVWDQDVPQIESISLGNGALNRFTSSIYNDVHCLQCHKDGKVLYARIDRDKIVVQWRADLAVVPDSYLIPFVSDGGIWLVCWKHISGEVRAIWMDLEGGSKKTFEGKSLFLPSADGDAIALQPDEMSVTRHMISGETVRFDLQDICEKSRAKWGSKKTAPQIIEPHGPGKVLTGSNKTFFVPWHSETIIDLVKEMEWPRKLPAKNLSGRMAMSKWIKRNHDRLRELGIVDLQNLRMGPKSFTASFWNPMTPEEKRGEVMEYIQEGTAQVSEATGMRSGGCGTIG